MYVTELRGERPWTREAPEQLYGIEIEVEGVTEYPSWIENSNFWNYTHDGSLRNSGGEFISPPSTLSALEPRIEEFYTFSCRRGYESSIRTGIHVHVDCRWRTIEQVAAICTLYAALEPLFFEICGAEREECIYCVPWYRAEDEAKVVANMQQCRTPGGVNGELDGACKYSSMYVAPLRRLGTIEFRQAPTFDTAGELISWIKVVQRCVELGHYLGTPEHVVQYLDGPAQLRYAVNTVFDGLPDSYEYALRKAGSLAVARMCVVCTTGEFKWTHNLTDAPQDRVGIYYPHAMRRGPEGRMYHPEDDEDLAELEWNDDYEPEEGDF